MEIFFPRKAEQSPRPERHRDCQEHFPMTGIMLTKGGFCAMIFADIRQQPPEVRKDTP
jgi:hypothetical protein